MLDTWNSKNIKSYCFSKDKRIAIVLDFEGIITVLSVPCLFKLWTHDNRKRENNCCVLSLDNNIVLFGRLDIALCLNEKREVPFFHGYDEHFLSCAFSPSGQRLITSDGSCFVKLWDVQRQILLMSLSATSLVDSCAFIATGAVIVADYHDVHQNEFAFDYNAFELRNHFGSKDCCANSSFSGYDFCAWNAITGQRIDKQMLDCCDLNRIYDTDLPRICYSCQQLGSNELYSLEKVKAVSCFAYHYSENWPLETFFYNGQKCVCDVEGNLVKFKESTHYEVVMSFPLFQTPFAFRKISRLKNDMFCVGNHDALYVFKVTEFYEEKKYSSISFSPDGSRLASCTSDGFIKIWNVYTSKVVQKFSINSGYSYVACWWSKQSLFVFDHENRISRLLKYSVDDSLTVQFRRCEEVSLSHLVKWLENLSKLVDFYNGLLIFECDFENTSVKGAVNAIEVSETLPPEILVTDSNDVSVSSDAKYIFIDKESSLGIWKKDVDKNLTLIYSFTRSLDSSSETDSDDSRLYHLFNCFDKCFFNGNSTFFYFECELQRDGEKYNNIYFVKMDSLEQQETKCCFEGNISHMFYLSEERILAIACTDFLHFYDLKSGKLRGVSSLPCSTEYLAIVKLCPKEKILAFVRTNGDIVFSKKYIS